MLFGFEMDIEKTSYDNNIKFNSNLAIQTN